MGSDAQTKRKKKRRKKNYLLRLLLIIALGVGLYYLLTSSFFDVQNISVENNNHYTKEQIISKADAKTGQNIFGVKTNKIKDALLEDPYIKNVRIKRSLPGTVITIVEERKEAAMVPYADTFIVMDKDGLVLRKSNVELRLPLLIGMTIKTMEEGRPLEVEETSVLTGTLDMLETMESTDMFFKKIDISNVIIKAYIYDQLICEGTPENVLASMLSGGLEKILYELYTEGTERGIIYVGSDNYYTFSPVVE
jgi:cell division protein FtsQ